MEKPEISVIIPAYNEGRDIIRTLIQLKKQKTNVPYEIIVVDNNSKDHTFEIAQKYADRVFFEKKQGVAFARNRGIKESKGRYLVHTDADVMFPDDFIERIYPIFKSNKYVGFTCGSWDYYDGNSIWVKISSYLYGLSFKFLGYIAWFRNVMQLPGWCICTPKEISEKVGHFMPIKGYLEDVLYSMAIEPFGKKGYFPSIKVRSSVRRLENGVDTYLEHYSKIGASPTDGWYNLFRKCLYNPKEIPEKPPSFIHHGITFSPSVYIYPK